MRGGYWVTFTKRQAEAVQHWVGMAETFTREGSAMWAPYHEWVITRDVLEQHIFSRRGGRKREVPRSVGRAFQTLVAELNYIDRHPAFKRMAMVGIIPEYFPAVQLDEPDVRGRCFSPDLTTPGVQGDLKPTWDFEHGITTWKFEPL